MHVVQLTRWWFYNWWVSYHFPSHQWSSIIIIKSQFVIIMSIYCRKRMMWMRSSSAPSFCRWVPHAVLVVHSSRKQWRVTLRQVLKGFIYFPLCLVGTILSICCSFSARGLKRRWVPRALVGLAPVPSPVIDSIDHNFHHLTAPLKPVDLYTP